MGRDVGSSGLEMLPVPQDVLADGSGGTEKGGENHKLRVFDENMKHIKYYRRASGSGSLAG
jgi:hypothetical protein